MEERLIDCLKLVKNVRGELEKTEKENDVTTNILIEQKFATISIMSESLYCRLLELLQIINKGEGL